MAAAIIEPTQLEDQVQSEKEIVPSVRDESSKQSSKRRRSRSRAEIIQNHKNFALRLLLDTYEGKVLEVLMQARLPFTIAELADYTGQSRHKAEEGAKRLVRRGLAAHIDNELDFAGNIVSGYVFQPLPKFPELEA